MHGKFAAMRQLIGIEVLRFAVPFHERLAIRPEAAVILFKSKQTPITTLIISQGRDLEISVANPT
jgi:hypothetical protein